MKKAITACSNTQSNKINRLTYILYLTLVAYLMFKGDYEWAVANLGIALIFDPFDATVKWEHRPTYQKAVLFCHLAFIFAGFAYIIFN